jgi:hypothetical protein
VTIAIPAHDPRIHLFAVSDLQGQAPAHQTFLSRLNDPDQDDTTLAVLLGAPGLEPSGAEVFAVADVAGMGLRAYLAEAYDIDPQILFADSARLDALGGDVIVLVPRAFQGQAMTLTPARHIRAIGTYLPVQPDTARRPVPPVDLTPAPAGSAPGAQGHVPWWAGLGLLAIIAVAAYLVLRG